ncbi:peroxiredoxin [Pseudooceanicola sp. CBS1P-1]|uniref:thioredoxin-dependent peroxiredoxin n=1 Tax=Pseudooceanicola albus TaxID=2692189 RepID=A0A6L7GBM2_9RHOB|nr:MULTISPECIES: peroxiredoxin [Pseudooceanicola]MBT9384429.1 peroxiredoxin [Pseudooceanicola endophyticus]MXN20670.1 redoxin domain-containing protein [Pseudooceanicola albus]
MLTEGDIAPDFTLPATSGGTLSLSELRPAPVVVFFYPKDDTPGCTTENKDFTALAARFEAAGAKVLGISKDTIAKHGKFRDKHGLAVELLSDAEGDVCESWGVWKEKKMYGKTFMGIERATFLIGADGTVVKAWPKVKVAGHAEEVLAVVEAL